VPLATSSSVSPALREKPPVLVPLNSLRVPPVTLTVPLLLKATLAKAVTSAGQRLKVPLLLKAPSKYGPLSPPPPTALKVPLLLTVPTAPAVGPNRKLLPV
jgi:hypothetical protein